MSETNVSAIAALQMRLKLEPKNPEAHFNLAVAYEETGSYEQALDEYDKSLDLNPLYARSLLHIGFISIKRNEPGKALDLWERAFTIDAKLAELFSTSPTAAYYKGKIDDVCAFFQKNVNSNPKNAKAHYELGLVYKYFNKLELALQCFRTATELNGVMWEAYLKCGETYSLLGVTKMALEQLKYGILANPGNENPVIYLALAEVYMKENMMGLAQQQLNKAIELDDKSVKAYVMRGKLFFRLANFKMAMKNYQTALGIDPKNSDAHYQLAKTCEAMYRPEFALLELEKAVACNPDFAEAYYDWGNLLLQMGETEKAIPKLEYVLKVNPNDSYAHYTLGTAYLKTEDYHAALHHLCKTRNGSQRGFQFVGNIGGKILPLLLGLILLGNIHHQQNYAAHLLTGEHRVDEIAQLLLPLFQNSGNRFSLMSLFHRIHQLHIPGQRNHGFSQRVAICGMKKMHGAPVDGKHLFLPVENYHSLLHIVQNHGDGIPILLNFPQLTANGSVLTANFCQKRFQLVVTSGFRQSFQIIRCFCQRRNNPFGHHSCHKHTGNKQNSTGQQVHGENLQKDTENILVVPSQPEHHIVPALHRIIISKQSQCTGNPGRLSAAAFQRLLKFGAVIVIVHKRSICF